MSTPRTPDATVQLLITLIGEAAATRMMDAQAFGGGAFTFPKSDIGLGAQSFAYLAEIVGTDKAQRLCRHFDGETLYVPKMSQYFRDQRNRRIVASYSSGVTVRELMREHGLSDRQIWTILKTTDMKPNRSLAHIVQGSLF